MKKTEGFQRKSRLECTLPLKRAVRAFPAKTSWGTTRPPIGQAAHGRRAGIILLTAWQIRGRVVPHEDLAGNALTSLFSRFSILMPPLSSFDGTFQ